MRADLGSCRNIRCARTPHTGGDETTNLPVTPNTPYTHCHLASKQDRFRADSSSSRFILTLDVTTSVSQLPVQRIVNSAPGVPAPYSLPEILSSDCLSPQLDDGIGDAPVLKSRETGYGQVFWRCIQSALWYWSIPSSNRPVVLPLVS